jgi:HEPN domain-containing protein
MRLEDAVRQWIDLADKDLASAEHIAMTLWPIPHEIVCYHCQQFVEKYLKAFLVSKGQDPPYIHDLVRLAALCAGECSEFAEIKQKCAVLTLYGSVARYPGGMQIAEEDMSIALQCARDIKAFMQEKIPELFQ